MAGVATALNTDFPPTPTPRPDPRIAPAAQVAPTDPRAQLEADAESANLKVQQGYQQQADLTRQQGANKAAYADTQNQYLAGLNDAESRQLQALDQGPFQPKQDDMAELGSMFMLVGMAGAFLGSKGGTSAAANAQAALSGIVDGWNKGDAQEVARQKAVYDENANYLKDKADKVREITKDMRDDAVKYGVPTAQARAQQRLITEADDQIGAAVLETKGMEAYAKNAESKLRTFDTLQEKNAAITERYFQANQAHLDRLAAISQRKEAAGNFTDKMGDLMAALAERGVSLPTGLRSRQQQASLYQGLLDRHPNESVDQIADEIKAGKISLTAEMREIGRAASILGGVDIGAEEIPRMGNLVLQSAAKVPRGSFLPINKLLSTGETELQDPNLKQLKININSLINAYDILAARGGTDVNKRAEAHRLITDADNLENLQSGIAAFTQEMKIAEQAGQAVIHKYDVGGNVSRETSGSQPNVTEQQYNSLKKGDKYWFNGTQYTKE